MIYNLNLYKNETFLFLIFFLKIAFAVYKEQNGFITIDKSCLHNIPKNAERVNSTQNSCTWKCKPMYYSTIPADKNLLPTCRQCSKIAEIESTCRVGEMVQNCTNISNTRCIACPNAGYNKVYIKKNNCMETFCSKGFFKNVFTQNCESCPENYYCEGENSRKICPENCSTKSLTNVYTSLGCQYQNNFNGNYFILDILSFIIVPKSLIIEEKIKINNQNCRDLNLFFSKKIIFGYFWDCTIQDTVDHIFKKLVCKIIISKCFEIQEYISWLKENILEENINDIDEKIKLCISDMKEEEFKTKKSQILAYSPTIELESQELNYRGFEEIKLLSNTNNYNLKNEDTPNINTETKLWINNKNIVNNVIGFFFILISLTLIGFFISFSICIWSVFIKYDVKKTLNNMKNILKKNTKHSSLTFKV